MKEVINVINQIIRYGLESNIPEENKQSDLEKNLINIYKLYFEHNDTFDKKEYAEFDITQSKTIQENIKSNFPEFGLYNTILNLSNFTYNEENQLVGDATDDLNDIINDLREVKWRLENNSLDDGIWFFKFIFKNHTKQHVLALLNYLNQK